MLGVSDRRLWSKSMHRLDPQGRPRTQANTLHQTLPLQSARSSMPCFMSACLDFSTSFPPPLPHPRHYSKPVPGADARTCLIDYRSISRLVSCKSPAPMPHEVSGASLTSASHAVPSGDGLGPEAQPGHTLQTFGLPRLQLQPEAQPLLPSVPRRSRINGNLSISVSTRACSVLGVVDGEGGQRCAVCSSAEASVCRQWRHDWFGTQGA